jgi:pSer/pThr/pTyr-binding forkhead associated (FHA) protein
MVLLKLLTGKKAGSTFVARRFPVRIGRSAGASLRVAEDGVWDEHLELNLAPAEGFVLHVQSNALASVNGRPLEQSVLRNGDIIEIGSLKMEFWLAETRQSGLRFREWLTWLAIAAVSLGQVGLVYWLLR